jgi:hypothetical protein
MLDPLRKFARRLLPSTFETLASWFPDLHAVGHLFSLLLKKILETKKPLVVLISEFHLLILLSVPNISWDSRFE